MVSGYRIWDRLRPSKVQLGVQLVGNLLLLLVYKQLLTSTTSILATSAAWHLMAVVSVPLLVTRPVHVLANSWLAKLTKEDIRRRLRDLDETFPFQPLDATESMPGGRPKSILLTGGTGFVGQALLFELLRCAELSGIRKIVVVIRKSRQGDARQRLDFLRSRLEAVRHRFISPRSSDSTCDDLTGNSWVSQRWARLVEVAEGDVKLPVCGVNPSALGHYKITHVVHCAAIVRFTDPLRAAAENNITGTLNAFELARTLGARMVHVSTAYVAGWTARTAQEASSRATLLSLIRSKQGGQTLERANSAFLDANMAHLLSSSPPDTGGFDPDALYRDMREGGSLARRAMAVLGHPNTYIFSKVIAEALLIRRACQALHDGNWVVPGVAAEPVSYAPHSGDGPSRPHLGGIPQAALHIVRPSIVTSAWVSPAPGWLGNRPTTVSGVLATMDNTWLVMRYHTTKAHLPVVPVDVVARAVLHQVAGRRPVHPQGHASAWTRLPGASLAPTSTLPPSSQPPSLPSSTQAASSCLSLTSAPGISRPLCVGREADARVVAGDVRRLLAFLPEEARDSLGKWWDISLAALCFGEDEDEDEEEYAADGVAAMAVASRGGEGPPSQGSFLCSSCGKSGNAALSHSGGVNGDCKPVCQSGIPGSGQAGTRSDAHALTALAPASSGLQPSDAQAMMCAACLERSRAGHPRGMTARRMPSFKEFTTLVEDEAWRHLRPPVKLVVLRIIHNLCEVRPRRHITELLAATLSGAHNALLHKVPLRSLAAVVGALAALMGGDQNRRGRMLAAVQRNLQLAASIPVMMAPFSQWPFRVVDGIARPETFDCTRYMQELIDGTAVRNY